MTRARLLVAILLLVVLAAPSGAQVPCTGASITFLQAPTLVQAGRAVRLRGYVVDQSCVPAQREPVGVTVALPSAPGTTWTKSTRTDRHGHFTISTRIDEPGVVLTVAVPQLNTVTGGISGPLTKQLDPLLYAERLSLTQRPYRVQAGTPLKARLGTTEAFCAQSGATYTVQTRPVGGTWQGPQVVTCQSKVTPVTSVLAATPGGGYPVWPLNGKAFQVRAVRDANGPFELPSVSAPVTLRVCKVLLPGC